MNSISGHISEINTSGKLSIVTISYQEQISLKSIIIETPKTAPYLIIGNKINTIFKETEVVIGTSNNLPISLQNRIPGTIELIDKGELISKVSIKSTIGSIVSIISTNALEQLKLQQNMNVTAMIKMNEIMLSE